MKILDIGCGTNKQRSENPEDEVIGIDKRKDTDADIIADIDNETPFSDNYFDKAVAIHTLEHTKDLIKVMEEIWRVCKPGAEVFIRVPYWVSSGTYDDPTHSHLHFTWNTFDYFTKGFEWEHYTKACFKIKKKRIMFIGGIPPKYEKFKIIIAPIDKIMTFIINIFPIFYQTTGFVYLFPARELYIWLEVIK